MDEGGLRSEETRLAMLRAGETVLRELRSVDELTVDQVCRAAGCSTSSFDRIFESWAAYLRALHELLLDGVRADALAMINSFEGTQPTVHELAQIVPKLLIEFIGEHMWFEGPFGVLVRRDPNHAALHAALEDDLQAATVAALDGSVVLTPPIDWQRLDITVRVISIAVNNGMSGRVRYLRDPENRPRIVALLTELIMRYLERPADAHASEPVEIPVLELVPSRSSDTRDIILTAAEELLAGGEALDFTIGDLCNVLGTSSAAIHEHFDSRYDIIGGVLERLVDESLAAAASTVERDMVGHEHDAFAFVRNVYATFAALMDDRLHLLGAFDSPPRVDPAFEQLLADAESRIISQGLQMSGVSLDDQRRPELVDLAVRVSAVTIQQSFWSPARIASDPGIAKGDLIRELALMTLAAIEAD